MDFRTFLKYRKPLFWAIFISICTASVSALADDMVEISTLEKQFYSVSNEIYTALSSDLVDCRQKIKSLKELSLQLENLKKQHDEIIGICLIQKNIAVIKQNIDSKEIFYIFQYLLENNDLLLAKSLYTTARRDGDKSLISNISYVFARYYAKRREWKKVSQMVTGIYNDLSFEDANYARLIAGIALQKVKAHRKAVTIYSKIPEKSKFYPASQLNIATAYLRQDWWTDAHIKINKLLSNKNIKLSKEMINRLYLVLGYSLLRKEYYRDAREAFRNIEVNSIYSNRALLGIALTATSQEDFISALNAINILKRKKIHDLTIDESYLLLPYIYEKLKQNMTASASYTDALNYYEIKINSIKNITPEKINEIDAKEIINNNYKLIIDNTSIDLKEDYPSIFLDNSKILYDISQQINKINNTPLKSRFRSLINKYNILFTEIIKSTLSRRSLRLNNYMNQARFGLARLFDSTRTTNE